MQQLRKHRRHKLPLQVEIRHDSIGTLLVEASDMSEGGVFLTLDTCFQPEVGEIVRVRSMGLGMDGNETGPELAMRVVRRSDSGIGLVIIEAPESTQESDTRASALMQENPSLLQAQPTTILQRFLFIDDRDRVLLQRQGDHWHLPVRELAHNEGWSGGLQSGLDEICATGAIAPPQTIASSNQCAANKESHSSCIEFLIPCRVFNGSDANQTDHASFRWAPLDNLTQQNLCFDRHSVDILLSRV